MQFKPNVYNVKNKNIEAVVTFPALGGMRISGSGKMVAANFVSTNLTASINESGYIFVGSSQYNTASYSINGSGDIAAGNTEVAEANTHISGSGSIEVKASIKLKASIAGSGNIYYLGNPTTVDA